MHAVSVLYTEHVQASVHAVSVLYTEHVQASVHAVSVLYTVDLEIFASLNFHVLFFTMLESRAPFSA